MMRARAEVARWLESRVPINERFRYLFKNCYI